MGSAWNSRFGGTSGRGSTGGRQFESGGSGAGSYNPIVTASPGQDTPDSDYYGSPGLVQINPLDPAGSLEQTGQSFGDTLNGLRASLFGTDAPDARGIRGGLGAGIFGQGGLGDIPVLGDALRGLGQVPGAAGALVSGAFDLIPETLARIPAEHPGMSDQQYNAELRRQYDAIPADFEWKKKAEEGMAADHDILGIEGFGSKDAHYMSEAIKEYEKVREDKVNLYAGYNTIPGSVADSLATLWDTFTLAPSRTVQGLVVGMEKPGSMGKSQLDVLIAVSKGEAAFTKGAFESQQDFEAGGSGTRLRPAEQIAVDKFNSHEWTRDEANAWLASHGAGYSHDPLAQIGGEIAFDPLNLATFGAGAVAKAGMTGAKLLRTTRAAEEALRLASAELDAARLAAASAKGARATRKASAAVTEAETAYEFAKATVDATKTFRNAFNVPGRINVIGRTLGRTEAATNALKSVGKFYESAVQGTSIGRGAKVIRTIIDPLHAMGLRLPGAERGVDLTSDLLAKAAVDTLGPTEHLKLLNYLGDLDTTGELANEFARDFAVAMANRGRAGIAKLHQEAQLLAGFGDRLAALRGSIGDEQIAELAKAIKRGDLVQWLKEDVARSTKIDQWGAAAQNLLARQMAKMYHTKDAAEWAKDIAKMSAEQRSFLKAAVYGRSNRILLQGLANMSAEAKVTGDLADKLPRLILIAKGTLTRLGADGLLAKLRTTKGTAAKARLIRAAQERYATLRYVYIDPNNEGRAVNQFIENLTDNLDRLPAQVTADEVAQLHPELQDLVSTLDGAYDLGFRPDERFLWGIERSNLVEGGWRSFAEPFVDHVADGGLGYRASRSLSVNILGHPLLTKNVRNVIKPLDYMDAGSRVMRSMVTGGMIATAAQKKFIATAVARHGDKGITEVAAERMWQRIQAFSGAHKGYSGPRGFSGDVLWKDLRAQHLIPKSINPASGFGERELMQLVLDAYDGDMRFIGLTQKLTARAKAALHQMTGSNIAAEVAEHAWPTMKFRLNPIFQLQEKIEGWVLNAARGVHGQLLGPSFTESDRATQRLLEKMVNQSLVSLGDVDQAEYSAAVMIGDLYEKAATVPGTRLAALKASGRQILNVQGVKRLNMLRTFQNGLGSELRPIWEQTHPGVWEDMRAFASAKAGRHLNDDEFALQLVSEQMLGNEVFVSRLGGTLPNFENAIKPGVWTTPTTLGELKPLDLDHVAKVVGVELADGTTANTLADLRRAIASAEDGTSVIEDVSGGLRAFGADEDYIVRVENALRFSWEGFWKEAAARFSLTADELDNLQTFVARSAKMRGMTPVDYMSQVFSPGIVRGQEGMLGDLAKPIDLMRKSGDGRAVIAGVQGVSTSDDLIRQMSAVFASHLDPSAKRALLLEFRPELRQAVLDGRVKFDLAELDEMWDAEAESQLADRILGYARGEPPTAPHVVVDDPSVGHGPARDAAAAYQTDRGVTPRSERRVSAADDDLGQRTADAYSALPEMPMPRTNRRVTMKEVHADDGNIKPKPAGVDDRTYEAYQDLADEAADQFEYLTKPKSKGGMGLKITASRTEPYETTDALLADLKAGKLRVYTGDADHPLLTGPQNVKLRAVHLVFGYAADGHGFDAAGDLNAIAAHAPLFSDTARAAFQTEFHGQMSWANYSNDLARVDPPPAKTYVEARARYIEEFPAEPGWAIDAPPNDNVSWRYDGPIGQGLDDLMAAGALDPEAERQGIALLEMLTRLRRQYPDVPMPHIDVADLDLIFPGQGVSGWTVGADGGSTAIILDTKLFTRSGKAHLREMAKKDARAVAEGRAPRSAGSGTWQSIVTHEFGHAVDIHLRNGPLAEELDFIRQNQRYLDFVDEVTAEEYFDAGANGGRGGWMNKGANAKRVEISRYALRNEDETMAELFAIAFDPSYDISHLPQSVQQRAHELVSIMNDLGVRTPPKPPVSGVVRELNAAKRGAVRAPQKVGLLPQDILDEFGTKYVGRGRHVESNPDVARTAQMFGKWTTGVLKDGILRGEDATHARILQELAGLPTLDAVPYNLTEAIQMQMVTEAMQGKWRDAFRLQYFAQNRSMLERTINHPMFGLYPASYMFGKIGPEVIRFIAKNPFGLQHGGGARSLMDAQAGITMQREFDPEFDAKIEKIGHSQALSWLGYMLPTLPWDVSASFPIWARDLAAQGLQQQTIAEGGGINEPTNLLKPAVDTAEKLNPITTTLPWFNRAVNETFFSDNPSPTTPALSDEPVKGLDLGPTLQEQMDSLRNALRP